MTKTPEKTGSNRDVLVLVPAELKVIVANAILDRANTYGKREEGGTSAALYALAGQIDQLVATGRNDRNSLYDRIARTTGVPRDKVKEVVHAFQYSGGL